MVKRIFIGLFLLGLFYLLYHYKSVAYGIEQAKGQFKVLWNAEEIDDLMQSNTIADSTKEKFLYIQEVRDYAHSKIGLNESKNYTTYFDQKGEPILWVVTASPEFKIEAYQWEFPIAGNFSYKGFFDIEKAKAEEKALKEKGFDTEIDEVSAWSTLGWFRDPILSSMLEREEGRLAELIIHELTHATIYKRSEVEFNENLATFIGREGAKNFLISKYGKDSEELHEYLGKLDKMQTIKKFLRQSKHSLDSLYYSFQDDMPVDLKRRLKRELILSLKRKLADSDYYSDSLEAEERLKDFHPNNAYFSGISTYHSQQDSLSEVLKTRFNGNLKALIQSLKD